MQQGNMGIPLCTCVDSESKGVVFRQTKVIRGSIINECEPTGRKSVPGICRNHIESGLQLCFEPWVLLSSAMHVQTGKQPEFRPVIKCVSESDQFDGCRNTVEASQANPRAIGSAGCERSLPGRRSGGSILLQNETAPVNLVDLIRFETGETLQRRVDIQTFAPTCCQPCGVRRTLNKSVDFRDVNHKPLS